MIGLETAMDSSSVPSPTDLGSKTANDGGASDTGLNKEASSEASEKAGVPSKGNMFGKSSVHAEGKAEPQAFQPSFKFKVLDKEKEFDEWIRPVVKDADTEKKVKELYEKAYGLDSVKQDRETLRSELSQAKEKISSTDKAINTISEFASQRDWDSFFEALSIPKNEILQYALNLVQREQMPPEQKAQWEASRQAQQQARYYQEQNQQLQQSQQQFQIQQREFELSQEISKSDISSVAEAYNAGMASPSAFREYVIRIGQAHAAQGNDIPVAQAVQEAVRHLRAVNPQLGMPAQAQETPRVVQPSSKPTLPNIQGRGTSPVKSTVRSLDDLRSLSKSFDNHQ
jgi:hypothetical protein